MNMLPSFLRYLSFAIIFFLSSTNTYANAYRYIDPNGSSIITDKRINKRGYKLLKVYKIKKKQQSVFSMKNLNKSYKAPIFGNGILKNSCSNKQHLASKARQYQNTIQRYSKTYGVEVELIHAIIKQESCFNEKAHSHAGAIGLMQLMPDTAEQMRVNNPWDPKQNIQGGVKYISKMLNIFKGQKRFAIAAYNAGPGNVQKYQGIPPYRETKNYVKKVMAEYYRLKNKGGTQLKSNYTLTEVYHPPLKRRVRKASIRWH